MTNCASSSFPLLFFCCCFYFNLYYYGIIVLLQFLGTWYLVLLLTACLDFWLIDSSACFLTLPMDVRNYSPLTRNKVLAFGSTLFSLYYKCGKVQGTLGQPWKDVHCTAGCTFRLKSALLRETCPAYRFIAFYIARERQTERLHPGVYYIFPVKYSAAHVTHTYTQHTNKPDGCDALFVSQQCILRTANIKWESVCVIITI